MRHRYLSTIKYDEYIGDVQHRAGLGDTTAQLPDGYDDLFELVGGEYDETAHPGDNLFPRTLRTPTYGTRGVRAVALPRM